MKIIVLQLLLLLFAAPLYGQSSIDSLTQALTQAQSTKSRADLLNTYGELCSYYTYRDVDSMRYFASLGLELNDSAENEFQYKFVSALAESYFEQGDMETARRYILENYERAKQTGNSPQLLDACSFLGIIARRTGQTDAAIGYYTEGLDAALKNNDYDSQTNLYTSIGILYSGLSRLDEALIYTAKAVEAADRGATIEQQMYAYSTHGSALTLAKRYNEALVALRKNLRIAKSANSPMLYVKSVIPLLHTFMRINEQDSVRYYMQLIEPEVAKLSRQNSVYLGFRETQATLYTKIREYSRSNDIYRELLENKENLQSSANKLYMLMAQNDVAQREYKNGYQNMHRAYEALDSLTTQQIHEQLSEMNVKYQTKEKELEILELRQTQMRRVIWFVASMFILSVLLIILLLVNRSITRRQYRLQKEIASQKREYDELQRDLDVRMAKRYLSGLEAERSRLAKELHDGVCNDLLGIGMQVNNHMPESASRQSVLTLLDRTREGVRNISHALMPPHFQYATIAEIIQDLVIRVNDQSKETRFRFECDAQYQWSGVPDKIGCELYRIAQEASSNTIKHAQATECLIELRAQQAAVILTITDNGRGGGSMHNSRGIGLKTIYDRAQSIYGTVDIQTTEQSTKIVVTIKDPSIDLA